MNELIDWIDSIWLINLFLYGDESGEFRYRYLGCMKVQVTTYAISGLWKQHFFHTFLGIGKAKGALL